MAEHDWIWVGTGGRNRIQSMYWCIRCGLLKEERFAGYKSNGWFRAPTRLYTNMYYVVGMKKNVGDKGIRPHEFNRAEPPCLHELGKQMVESTKEWLNSVCESDYA